jgi:hypothetical protein
MLIDSEDQRLTKRERDALRAIALRLRDYQPTPPLPPGYQSEIDRVFGSCSEDGETQQQRPAMIAPRSGSKKSPMGGDLIGAQVWGAIKWKPRLGARGFQ